MVLPSPDTSFQIAHRIDRLLEHAANYFDLDQIQDGETKRALRSVQNKRLGKSRGGESGADQKKKKAKTSK
jgi:hypothetical protein